MWLDAPGLAINGLSHTHIRFTVYLTPINTYSPKVGCVPTRCRTSGPSDRGLGSLIKVFIVSIYAFRLFESNTVFSFLSQEVISL